MNKDTALIDKDIELKENTQRNKTFNGLSAREWAKMSCSVWNDVSSTRKTKHLIHGATYPEKLCSRLIQMYSKYNDIILDPFLGTGTTTIAAIKNKRNAIGIELSDKYFQIAFDEIEKIYSQKDLLLPTHTEKLGKYQLFHGDCLSELKKISNEHVQLTLTSPPYADLIHKVVEDRILRHKKSAFVIDNNATTKVYSTDFRDLGNMPIDKYLKKIRTIMKQLFRVTKTGGYNAWVVKDFRDTKNKIPYVDLHSKIAEVGEKVGFKYHDLIIWDQNQHRKLVLLGYPSVFYVNQNHSYIVILRKI